MVEEAYVIRVRKDRRYRDWWTIECTRCGYRNGAASWDAATRGATRHCWHARNPMPRHHWHWALLPREVA